MILVSLILEDNVWFDEIKICYIFEYQSNENRAFRFIIIIIIIFFFFFFFGGGDTR